jgi:hypothetical protein
MLLRSGSECCAFLPTLIVAQPPKNIPLKESLTLFLLLLVRQYVIRAKGEVEV